MTPSTDWVNSTPENIVSKGSLGQIHLTKEHRLQVEEELEEE